MILECNGFTIYDYDAGELSTNGGKPLPITLKEVKKITDRTVMENCTPNY